MKSMVRRLSGVCFAEGARAWVAEMKSAHAHLLDYPFDKWRDAALHEKAKKSQWNGSMDLDWSRPVDPFNLRNTAHR